MALLVSSTMAWAQGPWTSGDCTVTWTESTKTLTISKNAGDGNGAMADYTTGRGQEWQHSLAVETVIIETGVTRIGDYAFFMSNNLSSVTIASTVTSIGRWAFTYCTSLTSIDIPNSVTSIEQEAFENTGLTSIDIPNTVTSIAMATFAGCTSLSSVTIPSSVTTIGIGAFSSTGLTSITIPSSVTSIGSTAFSDCPKLATIVVDAGNSVYDSRNCNAIIETASNTIVAGCKNTTIPNSVEKIGEAAFAGCTSLTSITIPSSVTSIGQLAFVNCTGLKTVNCEGTSVPTLGANAFVYQSFNQQTMQLEIHDLDNLTAIYVPGGSIDNYGVATNWSDYKNVLKSTWAGNNVASGDFAGYWSTYYNGGCAVEADADTHVYYITAVGETTATLAENEDDKVIPAGTGVLLKSANASVTLSYTESASTCSYSSNKLHGVDTDTNQSGTNYVLSKVNGDFGFFKLASSKQLSANRAYLSGTSGAPDFGGFNISEGMTHLKPR